jgi:hypothetical protein
VDGNDRDDSDPFELARVGLLLDDGFDLDSALAFTLAFAMASACDFACSRARSRLRSV